VVGGAGGGIFQFIQPGSVILSVSYDLTIDSPGNVGCNCESRLIIDGTTVDSTFAGVLSFTTFRDTLSFEGPLAPGVHEIRIELQRGFFATNAQLHYVDNVVVTTATPTPTPTATPTLLPTATPTATPSATPTATLTATPTPIRLEKVTVCHKGEHSISASANAVTAHLAHGDVLGACP
jgi:hypothetical protein